MKPLIFYPEDKQRCRRTHPRTQDRCMKEKNHTGKHYNVKVGAWGEQARTS